MNDLQAQASEQAPSQPPAGAPPGLADDHSDMSAKFLKLKTAGELLGKARGTLDQLVTLGDVVTPEDVVKGAGSLVGAGLSPEAMAGLLAEMPSTGGSEALAEWLAQQDQGLREREAQLMFVKHQVQHQMGVGAMRLLMAHSAQQLMPQMGGSGEAPPEEAPASNPLMTGG